MSCFQDFYGLLKKLEMKKAAGRFCAKRSFVCGSISQRVVEIMSCNRATSTRWGFLAYILLGKCRLKYSITIFILTKCKCTGWLLYGGPVIAKATQPYCGWFWPFQLHGMATYRIETYHVKFEGCCFKIEPLAHQKVCEKGGKISLKSPHLKSARIC